MEKLPYKECENCEDWNRNGMHCMEICTKPYDAFEEFAKYMEIGTVEECREAVEKTKRKKTKMVKVRVKNVTDGCPNCGEELWQKEDFCPRCGQAIFWKDNE